MNSKVAKIECVIRLWSEIGHCPRTGRVGSFCDELSKMTIIVDNIQDAITIAGLQLVACNDAARGHISAPEWWNQNERSIWIDRNTIDVSTRAKA